MHPRLAALLQRAVLLGAGGLGSAASQHRRADRGGRSGSERGHAARLRRRGTDRAPVRQRRRAGRAAAAQGGGDEPLPVRSAAQRGAAGRCQAPGSRSRCRRTSAQDSCRGAWIGREGGRHLRSGRRARGPGRCGVRPLRRLRRRCRPPCGGTAASRPWRGRWRLAAVRPARRALARARRAAQGAFAARASSMADEQARWQAHVRRCMVDGFGRRPSIEQYRREVAELLDGGNGRERAAAASGNSPPTNQDP